jgi:small conductance mechanosensitive channel
MIAPLQDAPDAAPPSSSISSWTDALLEGATDPALWTSLGGGLLRILLIVALGLALLRIIRRLVNRWIASVEDLDRSSPRRQRAETIGNLIRSLAQYVIWPIITIMVLSELNIDVGALLATAGIAGLAIGFGAQTLVKDVIGGVFLLFDDIIHVGDLVVIGSTTGSVEEIGVRLVKVRAFDGELVMVPAGEIRTFGNKSIDWARVIVPIGLSYNQDVDAILPIIEQVAQRWVDEHRALVLEDAPQVQSITQLGDSSVTVRVVVQVKAGEQFAAERELRRRLKRVFDAQGVEIPFPQRTLHVIEGASPPPETPRALPNSPSDADLGVPEGAD